MAASHRGTRLLVEVSIFSAYENPNAFAEVLVFLIPVAVGLLLGARSLWWTSCFSSSTVETTVSTHRAQVMW